MPWKCHNAKRTAQQFSTDNLFYLSSSFISSIDVVDIMQVSPFIMYSFPFICFRIIKAVALPTFFCLRRTSIIKQNNHEPSATFLRFTNLLILYFAGAWWGLHNCLLHIILNHFIAMKTLWWSPSQHNFWTVYKSNIIFTVKIAYITVNKTWDCMYQ